MKKILLMFVSFFMFFILHGVAYADLTDGPLDYYPFNGNANECEDELASVPELINAINSANQNPDCNTICLSATTFTLSDSYEVFTGLPEITSCIIIRSTAKGGSTIKRDSNITSEFRIFFVESTGDLTLKNITLTNGIAPSSGCGGAISNHGKLTIIDSIITGNITFDCFGGGIFNSSGGTVRIFNSTISKNEVAEEGGGGGIANEGIMEIIDSTIIENTNPVTSSLGGGGGILNYNGTLQIVNSTVTKNEDRHIGGGGIYNNNGSITIIKTSISNNRAISINNLPCLVDDVETKGGGIYNSEGGKVELINSTVSGNSVSATPLFPDDEYCDSSGGGIYNNGTMTMTNTTLSGNSSDFIGGGITNDEILFLNGSIISGNTAPRAAEVRNHVQDGVIVSNNYNLFGHKGLTTAQAFDNFRPQFPPPTTDIVTNSDGNMPTSLDDILDTTLDNNGGLTQTHALVENSPAIDSIPLDASGTGCITTNMDGTPLIEDQRAVKRPIEIIKKACDIGAYEAAGINNIDNKKAGFTFFYKDGITEEDRLSIVGYLEPKLETMPFGENVTITIMVPDPRDLTNTLQLFTQVVPAGVVSGTTKYRFRSGDSGIQELLFDQRSDSTYFYIKVDEVDFLPGIRAAMSPQDYLDFIRNITSYTITIKIDGKIWIGSAPLKPGTRTIQKQELNFWR